MCQSLGAYQFLLSGRALPRNRVEVAAKDGHQQQEIRSNVLITTPAAQLLNPLRRDDLATHQSLDVVVQLSPQCLSFRLQCFRLPIALSQRVVASLCANERPRVELQAIEVSNLEVW